MNSMGGILPTLPMWVRGQGVDSLSMMPILVKSSMSAVCLCCWYGCQIIKR